MFFRLLLTLSLYFTLTSALSLNVVKKKGGDHDHDHTHGHKSHNHTGVCRNPLYGEDPYFTRRLFNLEEILAQELTKLVDTLKYDATPEGQLCVENLQKYLQEQQSDAQAIEADRHRCSYGMQSRADIVAENPIFTFKMLRRLVLSLQEDTLTPCQETMENDLVSETVSRVFQNASLIPPQQEELDVAVDAILTLVFVYGFNVSSDFRVGKYYDYQTKAHLDFADIVEILIRVLEQDEKGFMTYQWLTAAEEAVASEDAESPSRKELFSFWEKALQNFGKRSIAQFRSEFGKERANDWDGFSFGSEKLCRGNYLSEDTYTYTPFLICHYRYYYITPIKIEIHNRAPLIIQFHDFLTNKEIRFIKYQSPSFTVKPWLLDHEWDESSREAYQLDHFTKLAEEALTTNKNPIVLNLMAKVEVATKYNVVPRENASIFDKALHTPMSGFWNVELNHDYVTGYSIKIASMASFLMFLTDVHMGGYTTFPKVNVFTKPYKGSALYFVNYDFQEIPQLDEKVFHESCPVILGVREVAHLRLAEHPNYPHRIPDKLAKNQSSAK